MVYQCYNVRLNSLRQKNIPNEYFIDKMYTMFGVDPNFLLLLFLNCKEFVMKE